MKKRLFSIFALSVLLVGIMAVAAAATISKIEVSPASLTISAGKSGSATLKLTNNTSAIKTNVTITLTAEEETGTLETKLTPSSFSYSSSSQLAANGTAESSVAISVPAGTEAGQYKVTFKESNANKTCDLTVTVTEASSSTKPTKPKFYDADEKELNNEKAAKLFKSLKWKEAIETPIVITAINETGEITAFTATMDPIAGVTLDVDTTNNFTATFSGTPTEVVSGKQVTISATSEKGTSTLKFKIGVGFDKGSFNFTNDAGEAEGENVWPTGNYLKGSDITAQNLDEKTYSAIINANPGPVVWKTKNLPAGIKATPINSTQLKLEGTFSALTQFAKDGTAKKSKYQITASNKAMGESQTKEVELRVFDAPTITTASLPDLTVGKNYKAKLAFGNSPLSYKVWFKDLESEEATWTDGKTPAALTIDKYTLNDFDADADIATTSDGGSLEWDESTLTISGTLNNVPASGKIFVRVFVGNPAGGYADDTSAVPTEAGTTDGYITKDFEINVKGVAPVLAKPDKSEFDSTGVLNFAITKGTKPIKVKAYITATDAKAVGLEEKIELTSDGTNELGLTFTEAETPTDQWNGTLKFTTGDDVIKSYKGLKVTLEAANPATGESTVKKSFAISNNASKEVTWKKGANADGEAASDITIETITAGKLGDDGAIALPAGKDLPSDVVAALEFYADVEEPYTITPASGTKINGLEITHNGKAVSITGIPTAGKDSTSKIKLVATNTSTKKKAQLNVTISAFAAPEFSNATALKNGKTIAAGKAASIKPKIKVNKKLASHITYSVTDDTGAGFELDQSTGALTTSGAKPTLDESDAYVSTKTAMLAATGGNGYAFGDGDANEITQEVKIDVKPLQPKIKTSKIVYTKGSDTKEFNVEVSNIKDSDVSAGYASLKYSADDIGEVADSISEAGVITMSDTVEATKGTGVDVTVSNYGVETTKKVTFIVHDAKPVITVGEDKTSVTLNPTADADDSDTVTLTIGDEYATGDTTFKWKITEKQSGVTVKITPASDTRSATLTVTAKKKLKNDVNGKVKVTAQNAASKATSEAVEIEVTANKVEEEESDDGATKDGEALAIDKATDEATETETMKEEDVEVGEGKVISGKARTEAALTATQRTRIAEAGYVVAAVLPEVEVTAAGQYPLPVEIPEEIAAGKELAWFAFSTKPSEDDEIVDFFDEEGKDTKVVPESHKITVYPWLNADVTYAPVIAVKADTGEKGAETEEQIKEKTVRAVKK